jgi:high-affinity Fe2+/Pb2+ permease
MNLFYAIIYGLISQVLSFVCAQGSYKIPILKNNMWLMVLMGAPISFFVIKSVHYFAKAFDDEMWPGRIMGFSVGIAVFSIMGWLMFDEKISSKTAVCLALCFVIIAIQILWKTPRI